MVFENWIKSDLIYVNDILDATKTLSSKCILEKLKLKSNWIAEFNIVKKQKKLDNMLYNWLLFNKIESSIGVDKYG
jgi:hypothetical protein